MATAFELSGSRPVSRRADGKARVRAGLLGAARALFARQGVAATTMDDVARLAAVSRATAFNYFPSKHLLLAALVHEMEARFLHIIDTQFDQPATAAERLAALFSWTATKVEETPELSRVLIGASETTFGAAADSGARTARTHRAFMRVLDAGRRRGQRACRRANRSARGDHRGQLRGHPARVARGTPLSAAAAAGRRGGHPGRTDCTAIAPGPGCGRHAVSVELLPWEVPAVGAAVDIAGDLRWIRLPVPGPLQHINVWLAPGRRRRVLIDTGMNQPETHAAWDALALSERLGEELEAILVTHHHPDHFGMAANLAARFDVPVRMSEPARAAAQLATAGALAAGAEALAEYRDTWGVDFEVLLTRARAAGVYDRLVSGMPAPTSFITEGERIAELRDPWHASLHHGHAEGHVCLYWRQSNLLISGDQLLPAISSNVSLYPGAGSEDPLADFLDSLERLAGLPETTVVLPAHGRPFRGPARARGAAARGT